MALLKGSDTPINDHTNYLKAQIVFWLIGTTGGHAKSFSIFLMPGQHFQLTPLYDILTAQPSADAGRINDKNFKLAMSVGANNHYRVNEITPRHFLRTVNRCNFDAAIIRQTFETLLDTAAASTEKTIATLGNTIPAELANSILAGINARLNTIVLWKKADAPPQSLTAGEYSTG